MPETTLIKNAKWVIAWDAAAGRHHYARDADVAFEGSVISHVGPGFEGGARHVVDGRAPRGRRGPRRARRARARLGREDGGGALAADLPPRGRLSAVADVGYARNLPAVAAPGNDMIAFGMPLGYLGPSDGILLR